jgi:hypothetical protein
VLFRSTQGDLKDLTETGYKKLKNVIERRGFSYPVYVWEDENKLLHLLDGHQRQRVLNREGWNEPIPYLKVPAKDLQEAMARLLEITSQYATITQEGIDEFIGRYELDEAEVYEATSFDALAFSKTEDTEVEEDDNTYTKKVEAPIYEPSEHKPSINSLFDTKKYDGLAELIEQANITQEEKTLLKLTATRHIAFNYENIADYYAHSSKDTQDIMEKLALVIIDFNKAIQYGYVELSEKVEEQYATEYEG